MVGIKSSPGVSNVQLHLTMTKVNTIRAHKGACMHACLFMCVIEGLPSQKPFISQIFSVLERFILLTC